MNRFDINCLQGLMLIATHKLDTNPLFSKSLIYINKHSAGQGAEGFILNKPTKLPFYKLFRMVKSSKIDMQRSALDNNMVLIGGPELTNNTFILNNNLNSEVLTESLLQEIIVQESYDSFEVFAGISSWRLGQLEKEVFEDYWLTFEPDLEIMFTTDYRDRYDKFISKNSLNSYMIRLSNSE